MNINIFVGAPLRAVILNNRKDYLGTSPKYTKNVWKAPAGCDIVALPSG